MSRFYTLLLLSCLLWVLISACGGVTQPSGERISQSPLTSPTAAQVGFSPVATPIAPTTTATVLVTPKSALYLPTFTPTPPYPSTDSGPG